SFFGLGSVKEAFVILLCSPAYYVKHCGSALIVRGVWRFFQRDSGSPRQNFQRFPKTDVFMLLNKDDDIATFATTPAAIALPPRIDIERRTMIVVEGAQSLVRGTNLTQRDVVANHVDNVVGLFD